MLINKHKYLIDSDHKKMHKVGKQWVVVSAFVLALLGAKGARAQIHADVNKTPDQQVTDQINQNLQQNQKLVKQQQQSNQQQSTSSSASRNGIEGATQSASASNNANSGSQNIMQAAKNLHTQVVANNLMNVQSASDQSRAFGADHDVGNVTQKPLNTSSVTTSAQGNQTVNKKSQLTLNNAQTGQDIPSDNHWIYSNGKYLSDNQARWDAFGVYRGLNYKYDRTHNSVEFTDGIANSDLSDFVNNAVSDVKNATSIKFDNAVNTNKVNNIESMFANVHALKSIVLSKGFNMDHIVKANHIFSDGYNNNDTFAMISSITIQSPNTKLYEIVPQIKKLTTYHVPQQLTSLTQSQKEQLCSDVSSADDDAIDSNHVDTIGDLLTNPSASSDFSSSDKNFLYQCQSDKASEFRSTSDIDFTGNEIVPLDLPYMYKVFNNKYTASTVNNFSKGNVGTFVQPGNPKPDIINYQYNGTTVGNSQIMSGTLNNQTGNYSDVRITKANAQIPSGYYLSKDVTLPFDGESHNVPVNTNVTTDTLQYRDIYQHYDEFPNPQSKKTAEGTGAYTLKASDVPKGWALVDNNGKIIRPSDESFNYDGGTHTVNIAPVYDGLTYKYDRFDGKQNRYNPSEPNVHSLEFTGGTLNWNGNGQDSFLKSDKFVGEDNGPQTINLASDIKSGTNNKWDESIYNVQFDSDVNLGNLTNASNMFRSDHAMTSLTLSRGFNPRNVTDMHDMFRSDHIDSLTLPSDFDTSKVTNMSGMFSNDLDLNSLDLPVAFNTQNVTDMHDMFNGDGNLQTLTLPNSFNTGNVKDMHDMFNDDWNLQSLTLPNSFDTGKVTNMSNMFNSDEDLQSLVLPSSFNTSKVTNMSSMFNGDSGLTSLALPSSFATHNVTDMNSMFSNNKNLVTITWPSRGGKDTFDTSNVTDMSDMFNSDYALKDLKLPSDFATGNVTDMDRMFRNNKNISDIVLPKAFDTRRAVNNMYDLFSNDDPNSITIKSSDTKINNQGSDVLPPMYKRDDPVKTAPNNKDYTSSKPNDFMQGNIGTFVKENNAPYVTIKYYDYTIPSADGQVRYHVLASDTLLGEFNQNGNPESVTLTLNKSNDFHMPLGYGFTSSDNDSRFTYNDTTNYVKVQLNHGTAPLHYETVDGSIIPESDDNGGDGLIKGETNQKVSDVTKQVTVPQGYYIDSKPDAKDKAGNQYAKDLSYQFHNVGTTKPNSDNPSDYVEVLSHKITGQATLHLIYREQIKSGDQPSDFKQTDARTIQVPINAHVGDRGLVFNSGDYYKDNYNVPKDRNGNVAIWTVPLDWKVAPNSDRSNYNVSDTFTYTSSKAAAEVTYVDVSKGAQLDPDVRDTATNADYSQDNDQTITYKGHTYPIVGHQMLNDIGIVGQTVNLTAKGSGTGTSDLVAPKGFNFVSKNSNDRLLVHKTVRLSNGVTRVLLMLGDNESTPSTGKSSFVPPTPPTKLQPLKPLAPEPITSPVNITSTPATYNNWVYDSSNGKYISDGQIHDWQSSTSDYDGLTYRYSPSTHAIEFTGGSLKIPSTTTLNSDDDDQSEKFNLFLGRTVDEDNSTSDDFTPKDINSDIQSVKFDSDVNTSSVSDVSGMFANKYDDYGDPIYVNPRDCKLVSIVLPKLPNVRNMHKMFCNDDYLQSIILPKDFSTSKVSDVSGMFTSDKTLKSLNLDNFDTSHVTNMSNMFESDSGLQTLGLSHLNTSNVSDMSGMFTNDKALKSLNLDNFDTSHVTNMSNMFESDSGLQTLGLSHLNTSNVSDMSGMFTNDKALKSLNLDNFDTSHVTNMCNMFMDDSGLQNLDVSHFDTGNVTNMFGMFHGDSGLHNLDVSHFDTHNVTDMSEMFYGDSRLHNLDVSHFDTSHVTNMCNMFIDDSGLQNLDVSHFDTHNVTNISGMFESDSGLHNLDVSHFDTHNITNMAFMFDDSGLHNLDVSHFDTHNVTDMNGMFENNPSLKMINLGHFDTSNVDSMYSMFESDKELNLVLPTDFNTKQISYYDESSTLCGVPKVVINSSDTRFDSDATYGNYYQVVDVKDADGNNYTLSKPNDFSKGNVGTFSTTQNSIPPYDAIVLFQDHNRNVGATIIQKPQRSTSASKLPGIPLGYKVQNPKQPILENRRVYEVPVVKMVGDMDSVLFGLASDNSVIVGKPVKFFGQAGHQQTVSPDQAPQGYQLANDGSEKFRFNGGDHVVDVTLNGNTAGDQGNSDIPVAARKETVPVQFVDQNGRSVGKIDTTRQGNVDSDVSLPTTAPWGYYLVPGQPTKYRIASSDIDSRNPNQVNVVNIHVTNLANVHVKYNNVLSDNTVGSDVIKNQKINSAVDLTNGVPNGYVLVPGQSNVNAYPINGSDLKAPDYASDDVTVNVAPVIQGLTIDYIDPVHNRFLDSRTVSVKNGSQVYLTNDDLTSNDHPNSFVAQDKNLTGYQVAPNQTLSEKAEILNNGRYPTYVVNMQAEPVTLRVDYFDPTVNGAVGTDVITKNVQGQPIVTGDTVALPTVANANQNGLASGYTLDGYQPSDYQVRTVKPAGNGEYTETVKMLAHGDRVADLAPVTVKMIDADGNPQGSDVINVPVDGEVGDQINFNSSDFQGYLPEGYTIAKDYINHNYVAKLMPSDVGGRWNYNSWQNVTGSYWDRTNQRPLVVIQSAANKQITVNFINQDGNQVSSVPFSGSYQDKLDLQNPLTDDKSALNGKMPAGYTYGNDNPASDEFGQHPEAVNINVLGDPERIDGEYDDPINDRLAGSVDESVTGHRVGDTITIPTTHLPKGYSVANVKDLQYRINVADDPGHTGLITRHIGVVPQAETVPVQFIDQNGHDVGGLNYQTKGVIGQKGVALPAAPAGYHYDSRKPDNVNTYDFTVDQMSGQAGLMDVHDVYLQGDNENVPIQFVDQNGNVVPNGSTSDNSQIGDTITLPSAPTKYKLDDGQSTQYTLTPNNVATSGHMKTVKVYVRTNQTYRFNVNAYEKVNGVTVKVVTTPETIEGSDGKSSTFKPSDFVPAGFKSEAGNQPVTTEITDTGLSVPDVPWTYDAKNSKDTTNSNDHQDPQPINVTYYDDRTGTSEGTNVVNGYMDQVFNVNQLGSTGLKPGYTVDSNQNQTYTISTQPTNAHIMVHGNTASDKNDNDRVTIQIYKEDPYGNLLADQPETTYDVITGNTGDKYDISAEDYLPAGYQLDTSNDRDRDLTGTIQSDGSISNKTVKFYYHLPQSAENNVKPIHVMYENDVDHHVIADEVITPSKANDDYVGKFVDVIPTASNTDPDNQQSPVPNGYDVDPGQDTRAGFSSVNPTYIDILIHANQNGTKYGDTFSQIEKFYDGDQMVNAEVLLKKVSGVDGQIFSVTAPQTPAGYTAAADNLLTVSGNVEGNQLTPDDATYRFNATNSTNYQHPNDHDHAQPILVTFKNGNQTIGQSDQRVDGYMNQTINVMDRLKVPSDYRLANDNSTTYTIGTNVQKPVIQVLPNNAQNATVAYEDQSSHDVIAQQSIVAPVGTSLTSLTDRFTRFMPYSYNYAGVNWTPDTTLADNGQYVVYVTKQNDRAQPQPVADANDGRINVIYQDPLGNNVSTYELINADKTPFNASDYTKAYRNGGQMPNNFSYSGGKLKGVPTQFTRGKTQDLTIIVTPNDQIATAKIEYEDAKTHQLIDQSGTRTPLMIPISGRTGDNINYDTYQQFVPQGYTYYGMGNHNNVIEDGDTDIVMVRKAKLATAMIGRINVIYHDVESNQNIDKVNLAGLNGEAFNMAYYENDLPEGYVFDGAKPVFTFEGTPQTVTINVKKPQPQQRYGSITIHFVRADANDISPKVNGNQNTSDDTLEKDEVKNSVNETMTGRIGNVFVPSMYEHNTPANTTFSHIVKGNNISSITARPQDVWIAVQTTNGSF